MRIISNFKDYYDSASAFGIDVDRQYVRYTKIEQGSLIKKWDFLTPKRYYQFSQKGYDNWIHYVNGSTLFSEIIVFCGEIIPCISYRFQEPIYFYDKESILKYFNVDNAPISESFFKRDLSKVDFFVENKIVCAKYYRDGQTALFEINPNLRKMNFAQVYPPYDAFQKVDNFVSGIVAAKENQTVEIADEYKISQHGFDKWSFRKKAGQS